MLRWITVPLFLAVMVYAIIGPAYANAANLAVWTLWWPALLLTGFLLARGWCSYCPLEAIGEFVGIGQRVLHEPAGWLQRYGPAISLSLFALIFLLEQATGMFLWSFATGILLLTLLITTVTGDLLLGQRGWCKYLCPLGRIVSLVSRISILELHSNHTVCISRCQVDECVKKQGCPMGLHPTGIDSSDHCILCLDCVRNCPHHSIQLDLRNPSWGLFNQARRGFSEALFSVVMVGIVIAAKGTPYIFTGEQVTIHNVWSLSEIIAALIISSSFAVGAMLISAGMRKYSWKTVFTICGLAYLPLAFVGLFTIYFRAFVEEGAGVVTLTLAAIGLDNWIDLKHLTPELGTLRMLIYPLIIAGGSFSWVVLGRLKRQHSLRNFNYFGHRFLILFATAAFVYLL
jgi:ferredoxin